MKIKKLSELKARETHIKFGYDEQCTDSSLIRSLIFWGITVETENAVFLDCNIDHSVVRYFFWEKKNPFLGRKYFPPGTIPWPESQIDFDSWSKNKRDKFLDCLFCPEIEKNASCLN
jgi:hypothetical protein